MEATSPEPGWAALCGSGGRRADLQRGRQGFGILDGEDEPLERGVVAFDDDARPVAVTAAKSFPKRPRRVPSATTPGIPVPGARMPRSSVHGSMATRAPVTASRGTRMSPCIAPRRSHGLNRTITVSPSTWTCAMASFGSTTPSPAPNRRCRDRPREGIGRVGDVRHGDAYRSTASSTVLGIVVGHDEHYPTATARWRRHVRPHR